MENSNQIQELSLTVPQLLPCNGRLVLQAVPKADVKSKTGIVIPVNFEVWTNENKPDRQAMIEDNPYRKYDFYIVAMAPEVLEQMKLANGTLPSIGDKAIISERFEPILYKEGVGELFFLIHWQDLLGIIKNKALVEQFNKLVN